MAIEKIWSVEELEALSPNDRDHVIRAGFITDPARVSPALLARARRKIDKRIVATEGAKARK